MMATSIGARAPLVGRDDELELLLMRVSDSLGGHGRVVLVGGEAGIGKTRLCEELESRARNLGFVIMVGRCLPGASTAFLPFHDTLRSLESTAGLDREAARALDDMEAIFATCSEDQESRFANERIILNYLDALEHLARRAPVLLRLEDMHWMDSASSLLMQLLARKASRMRILVLATFRPEDLLPGPDGRPHPFTEVREELAKDKLADTVILQPLSPEDLRHGLEGMLGGEVDEKLSLRLWEESSGNPLFALETVRLLVSNRDMILSDGVWTSPQERMVSVPSSVKEVVLRRVERMPGEQRRVLEFASVVGVRFDPALLAMVMGAPPAEVGRELEAVERDQGMLAKAGGQRCFTHETMRKVIYGEIGEGRRREMHRMAGYALESTPPLEERFADLSYHFREGRVRDKCADYSTKAGSCCLRRYALPEALVFFDIALGYADPSDVTARTIALEGSGDALFELRKYEEAYARFDDALGLVSEPGTRGRLLRKSGECWWPTRLGRGSKETMLKLFEEAEACKGLDPYDRAEVLSNRAVFAAWDGELDQASEYCEQAESILEGLHSCERLGLELVNHLSIALSQGKVGEATAMSERITRIYARFPSLRGELEAVMCEANCQRHAGSRKALDGYRAALDMCSKLGDHIEGSWSHIFISELHDLYDEHDLALREAKEAVVEARRSESAYMLAVATSVHAMCLVRLSRVREASDSLDQAVRFGSVVEWKLRTMMHFYLNLAKAEVLTAMGEEAQAKEFYENALSIAHGGVYGALRECSTRLRYGRSLLAMGCEAEAKAQLEGAARIANSLGNLRSSHEVELGLSSLVMGDD